MELCNSFLYKIYIINLDDFYLSSLNIIKYNDIGGNYITASYFSDFKFDNEDGILINNRNRRIFLSNVNIIKCIPIETI